MFDFNSDCVKSPVAAAVTTAGAAIYWLLFNCLFSDVNKD